MNTPARYILLTILVILQLLAPLVHAHTSGSLGCTGLHVPGLKIVNSFTADKHWSVINYSLEPDGLVIGVNAGIRQNLPDLVADGPYYGYPVFVSRPLKRPTSIILFRPALPLPIPLLFAVAQLPQAPRAPPL